MTGHGRDHKRPGQSGRDAHDKQQRGSHDRDLRGTDDDRRAQHGKERFDRRGGRREHTSRQADDRQRSPREHTGHANREELTGSGREKLAGSGRESIDRSNLEGLKGRDRAFELQRLNEDAKLNHRLDNAQRLRDMSARNGNTRLADTADRMEEKAYGHYDRRMERIDQQQQRFRGQDGDAGGDVGDRDSDGSGNGTDEADGDTVSGDAHEHDANGGHDRETDGRDDRERRDYRDTRGRDTTDTDSLDDGADGTTRNGVLDKQALNEQRKLDHRLGQADHLREIADRNGNPNLYNTADRMEQKAWNQYDRKMQRIDGRGGDGLDGGGDGIEDRDGGDFDSDRRDGFDRGDQDRFDGDSDSHLDDADQTGDSRPVDSATFDHRLANEQRKLDHRLQQADHLREIADRNGNPNLYNTADRMEQKAFEHYNRRVDQLGRNQGLSDLSTDPVPNDLRNPARRGDLSRQLSYEEQRLRSRLDTAQQLRDYASQTGNEQLLDAADQLEQRALDDYERRLDATQQYERYSQFDQPRYRYDDVFTPGEQYWEHYDPESYGLFRRVFGR